jgi:hypothetical protein
MRHELSLEDENAAATNLESPKLTISIAARCSFATSLLPKGETRALRCHIAVARTLQGGNDQLCRTG